MGRQIVNEKLHFFHSVYSILSEDDTFMSAQGRKMSVGDDLNRIAKGEILYDSWSRKTYSVDASHYAITPSLIVCPQDEYDIQKICKYCFSKNIPITARGAGTSLGGQ